MMITQRERKKKKLRKTKGESNNSIKIPTHTCVFNLRSKRILRLMKTLLTLFLFFFSLLLCVSKKEKRITAFLLRLIERIRQ